MSAPESIIALLGDRHNGEQTCRFVEGATEYIYKPRNADTENAFKAFLRALGNAGLSYLPGCVEVVRQEAAWHTELPVEHLDTDAAGAARYFRRAGTLLFLAYLLGASDLHAENLIANGEYPVLVDYETLLGAPHARSEVDEQTTLAFSVLQTHLLPIFLPGEAAPEDKSGFSGQVSGAQNLPTVDGAPQHAAAFLPQLTQGFTQTYRFALENTALLTRLLGLFDACRIRQILRPTATYGKFLELLAATDDAQRETVARELVTRAYARDRDVQRTAQAAAVIDAEVQSLLRGDVPLFYTRANETALYCAQAQVLPQYLRLSAVACARARLAHLCQSDLDKQLSLITLAYDVCLPVTARTTPQNDWMHAIDHALQRCRVPLLGSRYLKLGFDGVGRVFWESAGFGLYDGLIGICCFYAACYAKTGNVCWTARLQDAIAPFAAWLTEKTTAAALTNATCCLSSGLSGMLSALLHIGELTGQKRYTELALQLSRHLTPEQNAPLSADVLSGAAGLALCLPKLPREIALPLAQALEAPLAAAKPTLTGAAHGAAGLALALGALQTVFADERCNDKILELLQWENAHFDTDAQNWPDLRDPTRHGFMSGWCSGAPGIGMTRKKLLEYTTDTRIAAICHADITRATQFLLRETPAKRATLCCGLAARVMAASYLGIRLPDSEQKLSCVTDARCEGLYHVLDTGDASVGLMQGLSGIGYALALAGDERCGGFLL